MLGLFLDRVTFCLERAGWKEGEADSDRGSVEMDVAMGVMMDEDTDSEVVVMLLAERKVGETANRKEGY